MPDMILSPKYKDFLKHDSQVEFLEGTTSAGKTTVGVFKFMLKVAKSEKQLHVLSGLDLGTIEKNIINAELGIVDIFDDLVEYNSNGKGEHSLPHIRYLTSSGVKIIYVLGYDNKKRWKKALGGQYGCLYIDEINIADMDFVREASMRCDYMMGTLNPDDPSLPIYKEYINASRPLDKWKSETPKEILDMLNEEHKKGWVHWFFSFKHNLGISKDKIEQIIRNVPIGTKLYKNKIQGIRGRSTGLIFSNFSNKNIISEKTLRHWLKRDINRVFFDYFTCGVDTSYSQESDDTIAFIFAGVTRCKKLIVLDEEVYNNKDYDIPIAPSDVPARLFNFLERNRDKWGLARDIFVDSADQATITELKKYKRSKPIVYNFLNSYKKMKIIDRIHLMLGWIKDLDYLVLDHCSEHLREMESYSWKDDKYEPEDRNDHTINACQYAWLPFKTKIGDQ